MEEYFRGYRDGIIGNDQTFNSPFGKKRIIYADWTASGRMFKPLEEQLIEKFFPFVANTHTEATKTGKTMTMAYHLAHDIIKKHVNASTTDIIITPDTGMTGAVNKFQRILGLKVPEQMQKFIHLDEVDRPIVSRPVMLL